MVGVKGRGAALALAWGLACIAHAENFKVPPGRLGEVAGALGVQAGVTITVTESDVADEYSPGVSGDLSLREALDRALRGTGAEALFYDRTTIRIVRAHAPAPAKGPGPPTPMLASTEELDEVVVSASKQNIGVDSYPGSVKVINLNRGWIADNAADGTSAITELLPVLSSTNLGPGRDKLFIRGLADSSFNGPTQATTGQYLGDIRLNYNAPDPDLDLYDMKRVEVLVGPQGTLYGAGSLGGVIRLVPNEPDSSEISAATSAGLSTSESGGTSRDGAAMLNLPLIRNQVALRVVAYGDRDAGYIDDLERGLTDVNTTASYGTRMALRVDLADWTLEFGGIKQLINSADAQYTLRGDPPLTRGSVIPQPFGNDYGLAYISVRHPVGNAELFSVTSSVWQDLKTTFDATGYDGTAVPERFEEDNNITLISHETRIAGGGIGAPWVAGFTTLYSSSLLSRTLGPLAAPVPIAGVDNVQAEAALFGQISYPFTRTLTGTIGERFTFANSTGVLIGLPPSQPQISSRDSANFSNTLGLDWHPGGMWSGFFHYQQGNRAGGLAVAPSGSGIEARKFDADNLNMDEIGVRFGHETKDPIVVRAAIFGADWNHMQADLVDSEGLPYTTNIGRGRLYGLDVDLTWQASPEFTLSAAAFLNDSKLVAPAPGFASSGEQTLPNVARNGGRLAGQWSEDISLGQLSVETSVRYVGQSRLGVGPLLDIPQGNYVVADADTRLDLGSVSLSLKLSNLGNVRANTFAFGNPFGLAQHDQMTPLQPRTLRFGIDARF